MITEIAILPIAPENASAFEAAVAKAAPLFKSAPGCLGMSLERGVERPDNYRLLIQWESVAHHMELFRTSDAFGKWRSLVGSYFNGPVVMEHSEAVETYF